MITSLVISQKAKGKLAIFLEKLIFFKTENVTAGENNKQQTLVRGKRVVLDKTLNLVVPKTPVLPKTRAPSKGKCIEKITSWNNFHKASQFCPPISDPI